MPLHVGDTKPDLTGRCTYKETPTGPELPVNLTGATLVAHVRQPNGDVLTITATAGDDGTWSAPWPAPIALAGPHRVELQATYSGGAGVQTFGPSTLHVEPQLA